MGRVGLGQCRIVTAALHALLLYHQIVHKAQAQEAKDKEDDEEGGEEVAQMIDDLGERQVGLHRIVGLSLGYRWHELRARHTKILFQRDEVVAFLLQRLDDAGQCSDRRLTGDTTGIVHEDDMSVATVHAVDDTTVDLVGRDTRLPVIGVYLLAHEEIVATAGQYHRLNLLVLGRISVSIVRRTEENGALTGHTLDEHTCELQLSIGAVVGVLDHVVVSEGMVADGVALVIDFLHQRQVLLHLQADHEEGGRSMIVLESTEDRGCPAGIGTVVEGEQQVFGTAVSEL